MLEEFAAKEHRSLGNLCFVLLTWATEQLQKAGTIERLLGKRVPIPKQGLQRNKRWNPESLQSSCYVQKPERERGRHDLRAGL
jgi:hypothetical protein